MKALVMVAVDVDPGGYARTYDVDPKPDEVLDYVKEIIRESAQIRLNQIGMWASVTCAETTPPVGGPPGKSWEDVWEQVRIMNASDHFSRMVAIAIPSPFLESPGTYVMAYLDRETQIH